MVVALRPHQAVILLAVHIRLTGERSVAEKPQVTAWGEMIRTAREAATPRLTVRAAAQRAGISKETWGLVERGYQHHRGSYRAVPGLPGTVAHMAKVVGLSPDRLEAAGNPDAAGILREMLRAETAATPTGYDDPTLDYLSHTPGLPADVVRGLIGLARSYRAEEPAESHRRQDSSPR